MTRLAMVTDTHLRAAEADLHGRLLRRMAEEIEAARCDVLLIGGDLAGRTVPHLASPVERNLLVAFIASLGLPTVVVRGNHDSLGDWDFLRALPQVRYEDRPIRLEIGGFVGKSSGRPEKLVVTCIPWLDDPADLPDLSRPEWQADVVLGHAALRDGRIKPFGQPDVPKGDAFQLNGAQVLADTGARLALFGHYHEPQEVTPGVFYGGSCFINDYGEPDNRGWTLVDLEAGSVEHRPLEQPRRELFVVPYREYNPDFPEALRTALSTTDSFVKLRVQANENFLARAKAWVEEHFADAPVGRLRVEFDMQAAERVREGAEAVSLASTCDAKFRHYLAARSKPALPDVVARATELLGRIELDLRAT